MGVLSFVPLSGELSLLVSSNEVGCEAEGPQSKVALGALAGVVHQSDGSGVVLLVVDLVLDEVEVHKVAHGGTDVPTNVVGVNVDLLKVPDHVVLVHCVGLLPRGSSGDRGGVVLVRVGRGGLSAGEGERVGHLEHAVDIQANEGAGGGRREGSRALLGDLHDHLQKIVSASCYKAITQCPCAV